MEVGELNASSDAFGNISTCMVVGQVDMALSLLHAFRHSSGNPPGLVSRGARCTTFQKIMMTTNS